MSYVSEIRKKIGHDPLMIVGASVIVTDEAGRVLLQHRADNGLWGYHGGCVELGENTEAAARRELEEETGLRAENWRLLHTIDTTPGFCTERIAIYLATGLTESRAHPDDDEFLGITKMPLDKAVALCMAGEFQDGKTVIGLLMADRLLRAQDAPSLGASPIIQRTMPLPSSPRAK